MITLLDRKRNMTILFCLAAIIAGTLIASCDLGGSDSSSSVLDVSGDWCIYERSYTNGLFDGYEWYQSVRFSQVGATVTMTITDECDWMCAGASGTLSGTRLELPYYGSRIVLDFSPDAVTCSGRWDSPAGNNYHAFTGNRGACF